MVTRVLSAEVSHTTLKCSTARLDCFLTTERAGESAVRRTHRIKNPTRMGSIKKEYSLQHFVRRDACESTLSRFWVPVEKRIQFYGPLADKKQQIRRR